jgi:erythronate-4-phosphate dehydrogenase
MKIVVDKNIPFIRGVLEKYGEVVYLPGNIISRTDVMDADALIVRTRTKCNAELLEKTNVRFIATATIGHDHIDADFCDDHNIIWRNAEGCNSSSVQQYIAAALIHCAEELNFSLAEKTIGIVGVGNVGTKVAALCRALGMRVLLHDPPRQRREAGEAFVPMRTIVDQADIITFHVPLNDGGEDNTFHLADAVFLSALKPHQILINSSRGEVVEGAALLSVLKQYGLAACVLDVWENEPTIDPELLRKVDIGTPHIAGYSADGKANGTAMSVNALSTFFKLGIREWYPGDVPPPERPSLTIDCGAMSHQDVMSAAIAHTYDIRADDERLRAAPAAFEKQRADYPLRREFTSYTIMLVNEHGDIASSLKKIGFTIAHTNTQR